MSKKKIAPKAATRKPSERPDVDGIALRMKGLARLVFHASCDSENADPIGRDAAFFISETLEDMAVELGAA